MRKTLYRGISREKSKHSLVVSELSEIGAILFTHLQGFQRRQPEFLSGLHRPVSRWDHWYL